VSKPKRKTKSKAKKSPAKTKAKAKAKPKKAKPKAKPRAAAKTAKKKAAPKKKPAAPKKKPAVKVAAKKSAHEAGRFVWHDLMTTDVEKSKAFYTALFGWQLDEMNMGPFTLYLIRVGDRRVGSLMPEKNIPVSHWVPYISVADTDEACERVEELGGKVCIGAGDVPKLGRFAVVSDPQGAMFSPLHRPDDAAPVAPLGEPPAAGDFCWDELLTSDPDGAAEFYNGLVGWTHEAMPMPGMTYHIMRRDGKDVAGAMQLPPDAAHPPLWLPYVAVGDVDASAATARDLGARVHMEPTDIPQVGRFAVIGDPTGATIALFRSSR
jgi:predicted enzyme related to lactoylglutathione lyase